MAVVMSIAFFVFFQVFLVEDWLKHSGLLPSGASPFSGMRIILLAMYLVVILPTALVTGGTVVYLRRRFSEMLNALIILLMAGEYLLFVTFFLTLFDIFLSGLPIEVAIMLVALALFFPALMIAQIMRAKRNSKYLRWAFKPVENAN